MSDGPASRYADEIHQAAGMVSVQADCLLERAYALMSDRAMVSHLTLADIALRVVDQSISFG